MPSAAVVTGTRENSGADVTSKLLSYIGYGSSRPPTCTCCARGDEKDTLTQADAADRFMNADFLAVGSEGFEHD